MQLAKGFPFLPHLDILGALSLCGESADANSLLVEPHALFLAVLDIQLSQVLHQRVLEEPLLTLVLFNRPANFFHFAVENRKHLLAFFTLDLLGSQLGLCVLHLLFEREVFLLHLQNQRVVFLGHGGVEICELLAIQSGFVLPILGRRLLRMSGYLDLFVALGLLPFVCASQKQFFIFI